MTSTACNIQVVDPTRVAILQKIKDKRTVINGCQEDISTLEKALNLFPDPVTWATTITSTSLQNQGTGSTGVGNYTTP